MCSEIVPRQGSIDTDRFKLATVHADDETACAAKGCSRTRHLSEPIELGGVAQGMAVPFAEVAFCSLQCAKTFAKLGPYSDIIPSEAEENSTNEPQTGYCHVYSDLYVEKIRVGKRFEYVLGATPEQAMNRAVDVKAELIEEDDVSPKDIQTEIEELG